MRLTAEARAVIQFVAIILVTTVLAWYVGSVAESMWGKRLSGATVVVPCLAAMQLHSATSGWAGRHR